MSRLIVLDDKKHSEAAEVLKTSPFIWKTRFFYQMHVVDECVSLH